MKKTNNLFILVLIIVIIAVVGIAAYYFYPKQNKEAQNMVGNDRDSHGCISSAGYSWDDVSKQCVRPWENKASTTPSAR